MSDFSTGDDGNFSKSRSVSAIFDRIERIYLRALRIILLVIATLMVVFAAWKGVSGLFNVSKSVDSVVEKTASVDASEITSAKMPEPNLEAGAQNKNDPSAAFKKYYAEFGKRYFSLFKSKFEPYRQPDDKELSLNEFIDAYISVDGRIEAISDGDLNFQKDKADLEGLLETMTKASTLPQTVDRLKKYKSAKRVETTKKVERTRTESRRGWDTYSSSCEGWYESPIGCPVMRSVSVPYTATIKVMEFPKGTQSHSQIFGAFQEKYFTLLHDRRAENANEAKQARADIEAANSEGRSSLVTALQILGGFLILMFFFLLIAIERHQRKIAGSDAPLLS